MGNYRALFVSWRQATSIVWRAGPCFVVALCAFTCITGFAPTVRLVIGRHLLDAVLIAEGRDGWAHSATWMPWLVMLAVVSLSAIGISHLTGAITTLFASRVSHAIGTSVLEKAGELDLAHFERSEYYDTLQRAQRDGSTRPLVILTLQFQLIQHAISFSTMAILLVRFRLVGLLLLLGAAAPQIHTQITLARAAFELQRAQTTDRRAQQYYAQLLTTSEYAKEMLLFRGARYVLERYEQLFLRLYGAEKALVVKNSALGTIFASVATLSYILFYGYVLNLTGQRAITVGELTLLAGGFLQCQADLGAALRTLSGLYEHTLFLGHLWEYLGLQPRVTSPPSPVAIPPSGPGVIEFRGVSFRYPGSSRWILRDINLEIGRGEFIAIVGHNGCGKSTLGKLLCRFYDPDEGYVGVEGVDIRAFELRDYRSLITAVFQDFSRYHLKARQNIGLSWHQVIPNEAGIRLAAKLGGVDGILESLPEGYDTILGTYFGHGALLSGGEWQKVAIARALARPARILLLDEPTASLDAESEAATFEMIRSMPGGLIRILITQRLAHAALADRVIVMEQGRVVEQGAHADLLRRGGRYAALAAMQGRAVSSGGGRSSLAAVHVRSRQG